jgi:hypothetical protein
MDEFSIQNDLRSMKTGVSNLRVTAQGIVNLSNLADSRAFYNKFNILAHGGAAFSVDIPTTIQLSIGSSLLLPLMFFRSIARMRNRLLRVFSGRFMLFL